MCICIQVHVCMHVSGGHKSTNSEVLIVLHLLKSYFAGICLQYVNAFIHVCWRMWSKSEQTLDVFFDRSLLFEAESLS